MANKYVALLLVVSLMVAGGVDARTRTQCVDDCMQKYCHNQDQFFCKWFCPVRCINPAKVELQDGTVRKLRLFDPEIVEGPLPSVEGPEASMEDFLLSMEGTAASLEEDLFSVEGPLPSEGEDLFSVEGPLPSVEGPLPSVEGPEALGEDPEPSVFLLFD